MSRFPGIDINHVRKLRSKRDKLEYYIDHQRKWIQSCESNGNSYTGENGPAIRKADNDELERLQAELDRLPRRRVN